jgi:hypothetical protein
MVFRNSLNVEQPPPAVLLSLGDLASLRESIDFTASRKEAKGPQVHQVFTRNLKLFLNPLVDNTSNDY